MTASISKPAGKSKYLIFYKDENGRRRKKRAATEEAVSDRVAPRLAVRDLEGKERDIVRQGRTAAPLLHGFDQDSEAIPK